MSDSHQVLVVEDDAKIAALLVDYLGQISDCDVTHLDCGDGVADYVRNHPVDVVVLDLMLPGADGLTVCRQLREFSTVPIIMLTAKVEEVDRILGLELGADDYVCKPFSPREVVARVKAQLRRSQLGRGIVEGLHLDELTHDARLHGQRLNLTPAEFRLLGTLSAHPGRVFSRDQLMDRIYSDHRIVSDRTVDSHVKNLRSKLAQAGGAELIESVYGVGYRLKS